MQFIKIWFELILYLEIVPSQNMILTAQKADTN